MKKHKHKRHRPHPRAPAPKEDLTSAGTGGASLRWIGWLGGVGLVLLLGFFLFHQRSAALGSGSALVRDTNRADDQNHPPARSLAAGDSGPALAGATNRPGAALNRDAEGHAADLNNQATRLLGAGDAKGAIPLFEQALALAPKDETFHFNLGHVFATAGDLTNAEHEYKEALHLLPDYPEAHNNYGNLLVRLGRLAEAEAQLNEAVEQMPESADFHNNLGVVRERLKETNEALLCFQKAVACDSNYWQAHFNLALASLARKNRERAIAELRETLRIRPGFDPAQRELARATGQVSSNAPPGAAARR